MDNNNVIIIDEEIIQYENSERVKLKITKKNNSMFTLSDIDKINKRIKEKYNTNDHYIFGMCDRTRQIKKPKENWSIDSHAEKIEEYLNGNVDDDRKFKEYSKLTIYVPIVYTFKGKK